jgi:hypothetical protein
VEHREIHLPPSTVKVTGLLPEVKKLPKKTPNKHQILSQVKVMLPNAILVILLPNAIVAFLKYWFCLIS